MTQEPGKVPRRTEVLIIGGGPAGLATAIAARAAGLEALVLDRRRPPLDKACGEGLMPDGLAVLDELGVGLDPDRLRPFHGIRYIDGEVVAEGRFSAPPPAPPCHGVGVRRTHLHRALVRRAEEVGVGLAWGVRAEGFADGGVLTNGGTVAGRWTVGADGLRSPVRRWCGLEGRPARRPRRFGVRRHFAVAPWSDCVEVYWAVGCEAYVTPVAADEVGVAILWSGFKAGFDELLGHFPRLVARLAGAAASSRDRGAGPLYQRPRGVVRGRVALVGDAAGYVDALTGEGLSLAFHQAKALAAALRRGDLASYARRHRRLARLPETLTELLLAVERRPALRRRLISALAREPTIFSRLLAIHARALPLRRLGLLTLPRLLRRLA